MHYAYPLTHSSRPSLQTYDPKFFQDIAGKNCMPLQTQNQEILKKVNYSYREGNERNVLDKYNRVKRSPRKNNKNGVSNDVAVIQMPYFERVFLARREEERRLLAEVEEQQRMLDERKLVFNVAGL